MFSLSTIYRISHPWLELSESEKDNKAALSGPRSSGVLETANSSLPATKRKQQNSFKEAVSEMATPLHTARIQVKGLEPKNGLDPGGSKMILATTELLLLKEAASRESQDWRIKILPSVKSMESERFQGNSSQ